MAGQAFGVIGLAVMGRNIALNVERNGFPVAVFNRTWRRTEELLSGEGKGKRVEGARTLAELAKILDRPRRVLVMVQAGDPVDEVLDELLPLLDPGDIVIDGGNSNFHDTERRVARVAPTGIHFFGMGISGGEEGALWGPSLMPGGDREAYRHLEPILTKIAAQTDDGPCVTYVGDKGAGHFVKMVHNGIEYGLMAAYAEGLGILKQANAGMRQSEVDAETTPLREPEHYQYDFNLADISEVWRRGSVIASWLLDLTAAALVTDPQLAKFAGRVSDSGEGRWTIKAAIDEGVPVPVLTTALYERFSSRGDADYADRLLSAMRFAFGGHLEKQQTTTT